MNRRQFLKAAAVSSLFPAALWGRDVSATVGEMQYRTLGHTGEKVSIVGVGGFHIGVSNVSEGESQRIIRTAIDDNDVARMDDPEKIFAPGGALESMIKARTTGKVRYIGFTGHKSPKIHLHMLN